LLDTFGPERLPLPLFRDVESRQLGLVERMIERRIQSVETSSCGRLFDAVASIVGWRHQTTYEGQAAMELEAAASSASGTSGFALTGDGPFQVDLRPAIEAIVTEYRSATPVAEISASISSDHGLPGPRRVPAHPGVGWFEPRVPERWNVPESPLAPARSGATSPAASRPTTEVSPWAKP
jgi:hypothetical protein